MRPSALIALSTASWLKTESDVGELGPTKFIERCNGIILGHWEDYAAVYERRPGFKL